MSEKVEIIAELKDITNNGFKSIFGKIDELDKRLASVGEGGIGGKGIMGQVLGANLLTGAIQRAGSALVDFGKDSFYAFGKHEQFQTALTTLLLGNKEQALALDNQLKSFAVQTPFELTEIQDATKLMIAYGSKAGNVVDEMRMLGDISSGVGSSLGEVAYLYGTLRTQGRAFSKDIYQFTGRGIPIIKELAKQFKVAESSVMDLAEKGRIGFKEIEKAFRSMTSEGGQFANMMDAQSKTLLGQTSNLADSWEQLKTSIGKSQEGILKNTVSWATEMLNNIRSSVDASNYQSEATAKLGSMRIKGGIMNTLFGTGDKKADERYMAHSPDGQSKMFDSEDMRDIFLQSKRGQGFYAAESIGTKERFDIFSETMFDKFNKASSSKEPLAMLSFQKNLVNERANILQQLKDRTISSDLAANEFAVIDKFLKDIKGIKSLNDSKKEDKKTEPKKLEAVAKHNRANQIIVNIENLVREYTNNMVTPQQAKELTVAHISKPLLAAVNDIYAVGQ